MQRISANVLRKIQIFMLSGGCKAAIIIVMPLLIWHWIALQDDLNIYYAICNIALIFAGELLFFILLRNASLSALIISMIVCLAYFSNDIVWQLRGTPLMAKDIFCLRTALSVALDYTDNLVIDSTVMKRIKGVVSIIVMIIFLFVLENRVSKKDDRWIAERVISAVLFCFTALFVSQIDLSAWATNTFWHQTEENEFGKLLCLYKEAKDMKIKRPYNYNKIIVKNNLAEINDYGTPVDCSKRPDIIVIMNEAMADFSQYDGFDSISINPIPNIKKRIESGDIKTGKLHVSVWGGDTANTEWEFLTQNSMINCPRSVPYNQYIYNDTIGFIHHLAQLGYSSTAIHPFFASGYDRENVYAYLGFEEFISLIDFDNRYSESDFCKYLTEEELRESPDGMYVRNKISDQWTFDKTIEVYEEKKKDGPVFIFDITMQNHGGYTYENYEGTIKVDCIGDDNYDKQLSQYLSLELESDKAFERLITYFEKSDRDIIILMFGDHQPDLDLVIYNTFQNKNHDAKISDWTEEEFNERYVVPYFLWSNFEMSVSNDYSELSANYLSLMLQDLAGIVYDDKTNYMNELFNKYPVITAHEVICENGDKISPLIWNSNENEDALFYKQVQYYSMFDQ